MTLVAYHTEFPYDISEKAAFTRLFNALYRRLCMYAYRQVNDRQVAEDLVQECFVRLWERKDHLRFTSFLTPYVFAAVRNAVHNHRRKEMASGDLGEACMNMVQDDPLSILTETETLHEIYRTFSALPPKCSEVLEMLYKDGKSYGEIATALGVKGSTVRNQKAKGINLIRKKLKKFLIPLIIFLSA